MKVDLQHVISVLALGMLGWASLQVYQMNAGLTLVSYKVDENYNMIKPMWQDFLVREVANGNGSKPDGNSDIHVSKRK
tara:strand:- start:2241 stop:2474 length:234 start_codon:yes stop_codon:yes gene_type:complete